MSHHLAGVIRQLSRPVLFCSVLLLALAWLALAVGSALVGLDVARAATTTEPNMDRPGGDLKSIDLQQADPALCRQACDAEAQCKAYTYVKPGVQGPAARCWLKSSVPKAVSNDCCTSGVKAGPGTIPDVPFYPTSGGVDPGPLGRGEAEGSLNGKKNPNDFQACNISSAAKWTQKVLKLLDTIFGKLGGTFDSNYWCGGYKREISTGITLAAPQVPPGTKARWRLLGGRGKLMADSMLCLLKDIGDAENGSLTNYAPSNVAGAKVDITQTVGLIKFDPVARKADLYQNVRICAPLLGCLDAQRQSITATIRESAPAWPSGLKLSDYPIANSYSIELNADWAQSIVGSTLPPLTILTPYGAISAQPYLNYESRLLPIDTPFSYKGQAKHMFHYPQRPEKPKSLLQDTYGRSTVPDMLKWIDLALQMPPEQQTTVYPVGWASQVGLGGRDGSLEAKMWSPTGSIQNPPERQDFNMTLARSDLEFPPTASIDAGLQIKWKPPDPMKFFPGLNGVADVTIEVEVNPSFKANYASQFGLLAREGILTAACGSAEVGGHCGFTETGLLAEAHSMGRISIDGRVTVTVDPIGPFGGAFTVERSFEVLKLDEDERWKPEPPAKDVEQGHAKFAWAGHAASTAPTTTLWQGARGYSGMSTDNLAQWTQACFKTKKELPEPPDPKHDPGKADDLIPSELPCNICVASNNPEFHEVGIKVSQYKASVEPSDCKTGMNNGCYDLCSWNKATGKWIQVERSGASMFGEPCGGIAQPR